MSLTLRQRALGLLARREHSRAELARKLAPHAESEEELVALLDDLAARRQLSDARYAAERIAFRSRRYGNARLAQELRQAGVSSETADAALAETESELERAHQVWLKKFGQLPADLSERARQTRFLAGRGFSSATIRQVLKGTVDEDEGAF
jgi:regulatory protein